MRRILVLFLVLSPVLWPLACSNGNGTSSPVTNNYYQATPAPTWNPATGKNWYEASATSPWGYLYAQTSLVFNGQMWVIAGNQSAVSNVLGTVCNDVWSSPDGVNWTETYDGTGNEFAARGDHASVVFNNAMWILGGEKANGSGLADAAASTDGVTWVDNTSRAFGGRYGLSALSYNGKIWVIGENPSTPAELNDVWSSTDGTAWTEATANAAFSPRFLHTSLVFNNAMWVIGGLAGTATNDVWTSTDGAHWTEVTAAAEFSARSQMESLVYDGAMWVIGGQSTAGTYLNDVWYSFDGNIWTQATAGAAFSGRWLSTGFAFNNHMWVINGLNGAGLGDVWYSP